MKREEQTIEFRHKGEFRAGFCRKEDGRVGITSRRGSITILSAEEWEQVVEALKEEADPDDDPIGHCAMHPDTEIERVSGGLICPSCRERPMKNAQKKAHRIAKALGIDWDISWIEAVDAVEDVVRSREHWADLWEQVRKKEMDLNQENRDLREALDRADRAREDLMEVVKMQARALGRKE